MTDRGGKTSLLSYMPAGVTGSDDDDDCTMTLVMTEANSAISSDVEYETERQTLSSCIMLNTTKRQIAMKTEVCEKMMRGMPRCSKHEC